MAKNEHPPLNRPPVAPCKHWGGTAPCPAKTTDYPVSDGEYWESVASDHGMSAEDLIWLNFETSKSVDGEPDFYYITNWYLGNYVGCPDTDDHWNRKFINGKIIHVPAPTPTPTPAPTPAPAPTPTPAPTPSPLNPAMLAAGGSGQCAVNAPGSVCGSSSPTPTPAPVPSPQMAHIAVHVQDCSGAAMPNVEVTASGAPNGFTNSQGNWDFGDVPPGQYTVTGLQANSTQASQTLQAPAGQITTFNLILCAIQVEIQINNSPGTHDDLVQLKCDHPAHRHKTPCQIKLASGAAHDHQITLGNPDGRLRFPEAGDTTKNVLLPASGKWVPFEISGEIGSAALKDAIIEARLASTCPDGGASAVGDLKGTKPATVFWFDAASIQLTQGGNYSLVADTHTIIDDVAVRFSAQATIRPPGVDCQSRPIRDLRIAIMQETSRKIIVIKWSSPVAYWNAAAPSPFSTTVSTNVRQILTFDPALVTEPVNDGLDGAHPLYSRDPDALQPPTGCPGSAPATSNDTPNITNIQPFSRDLKKGPTVVGTAYWRLDNVTRRQDFHTFCVVFDTATGTYCCLRQATWTLNLDTAGNGADQHAVVNPDGPVTSDPATGKITANHAHWTGSPYDFGSATTTLTNP